MKQKKKQQLEEYRKILHEREESERARATLASKGKRRATPIIIVILAIAAFVIYRNSLADSPASPTAQNLITETSDTTPANEGRPSAKCMDGSALTVTSRDGSQTNYRCESGAEGSYANFKKGE